jgi:oxaloacetate decarboxylase gamma subunit
MVDQLVEASVLLGVGMSVVFAFLTLLIGGIHAIAWFERTFPTPPEQNKARPRAAGSINNNTIKSANKSANNNAVANNNNPTTVSPQIAAAISAAVNTHRQTTSK